MSNPEFQTPSQEAISHDRNLLLALGHVAQAFQKARTAQDFYRTLGDEIKSLGGEVVLLTMDKNAGTLTVDYTSYAASRLEQVEKTLGMSAIGYRFVYTPDSIFARKLTSGNAEFIKWTGRQVVEMLPPGADALAEKLINVFDFRESILAPLRVDDETLGLLIVSGLSLSRDNVLAIDSFAGQIAAGLYNVRLMQKLENELTARKQVEEALRASEAKIHALLDAIPDMMFVLNHEGIFLDYYAPKVELLFAPPESFLGKNIRDVLPPNVCELYTAAAQSGKSQLFEYTLKMADQLRYFEAHITAYQSDKSLCIIRDITGRKIAEEALRQTEEHFKVLIEKSSDGIALIGLDGKTKYASPSTRNIFNYEVEDEAYNDPMKFIHPDDFAEVLGAINDLIQNPAYIPKLQYRYKHKDDSYHWVESIFRNLLAEPSVQAVVINFRDITDQKLAEISLRESENKFHSIITESADGIVITNEEGRIIEFNSASEQIVGLSAASVAGRFVWDVQFEMLPEQMRTPECIEQFRVSVQQALNNGHAPFLNQASEMPFKHPDGTLRYIQQRGFTMQTQQGWRLGSIMRDVTERRQAEEALRISEQNSKSLYQIIRMMTDNLPDLVWAKDMDGRYLFANKAIVEKLLIASDTEEPIGQTDLYFALRQRATHPEDPNWHTFGELCINSDEIIHASKQAQRFEEFGNVKGQYLFLDVYKAPFLDEQGNMIGTVGVGRDMTYEKNMEEKNKKVQEALAASEMELRALFASMQDTVLVIDRGGAYRRIAPTNPDKLYIPPQEVIGRNIKDFFSAEQTEKFLKVIEQVLATGQIQQIEYEILLKGDPPWFEASISPMGDDCTLWVARDISDRKRVEAKLHLQSAALEAIANTIVITNQDGLIEWVNSAFTRLTGYTREEAIGKNPSVLVKSGRQEQHFYKTLWDTILSGNIWHNELINRRKDGSLYYEEMTITPLRNLEDEISHFIAFKQDVTERKQAEAALIQSELAYRTLFENMPIGLYRTSVDGKILDVNPALIKMFGYPNPPSLLAKNAEDMYADPDSNIRFKNEISKAGMLSAFEAEFRRYDQTTFWAEDYVHIIYDEAGEPLYYEGSLIDITERKLAEDELRRANKSLETTHLELQQMLAHEQILARTDGLTALNNRRYFFELATREFNIAVRYGHALTVILFDIDGFKQANDTFGHDMGDRILVLIALAAAAQVRDVDILARYGGDEFIILLTQTNAEQAFVVAERIRESAEALDVQTDSGPVVVTLSIGVAELVNPQKNKSIEDVIRHADQALYTAKKNGRNHTFVYKES